MNGHFTFPSGETLSGSLAIRESGSVLSVWGASSEMEFSDADVIPGMLADQKPIALMGCIPVSRKVSFGPNGRSLSYEILPHHVVIGNSEISYADEIIEEVVFEFDDAFFLFKNNAIDILMPDPAQLSEFISSQDDQVTQPVQVGKYPVVSYYTDANAGRIFSVETVIGRVSAHNRVTQFVSDREGAGFTHKIVVAVQFEEPINISELQSRMEQLLRFFGIVIGRPQNLVEAEIRLHSESQAREKFPKYCAVHFHSLPRHTGRQRTPSPQDVLINAGTQGETFGRVLRAWLEREQQPAWQTARRLFFLGWSQGRSYDAARLVSAANMFDHLPSGDFLSSVIEDILQAPIQDFQQTLKELPPSPQRDYLLGALGRVAAPTHKQKVQKRSTRPANAIGHMLPDLEEILDFAVNCRNLYTHGSGSQVTRRLGPRFIFFLTNALEFVFVTSDLIEAGWDIAEWCDRQKFAGHPFYSFLYGYSQNLDNYHTALGELTNGNEDPLN